MKRSLVVLMIGIAIICLSCAKSAQGPWLEPASVAKYKLAFIYRSYYKTNRDFFESVETQVLWLREHNYIVLKPRYEYGFDMTRKQVLKFAVIYYYKEQKEMSKMTMWLNNTFYWRCIALESMIRVQSHETSAVERNESSSRYVNAGGEE